ncbi:MAG: GNAT family N-acetyltransferase [Deltaproteobacteria bacterium]|nr:GNAT family N-acetyltransferase [Deltaproteobacteria bacterium]
MSIGGLQIRSIEAGERDAVLDLLKEWLNDRAFFARYFQYDRAFRDDLCFVATDHGNIVSTFQVFRKQVRIDGQVLQVGGVGNVFTTETYRQRHIASQLLTHGLSVMADHGFDLSMLFASRLKFYSALGWQSHLRHLLFIDSDADNQPQERGNEGPYTIAPFEESNLSEIRAVYDCYSGRWNGTTVRDAEYWRGQLRYAGNPQEHFLIARQGERLVAYLRGTTLYGFYVLMEHGYMPGHAEALTQLVCRLHAGEAATLPGMISHLGVEPEVQEGLRRRGLSLRQVEDVFWMWRVIDPERLAAKLRLPAKEILAEDLFFRLLPPSESVYWIADRF